ncbi:MAG TPA: contractile injection system protein, VgrG/Pvc8 family [Acidocella sp.]|jgi:prophage tail gpP-like protein|uniref:phage baseplate assembly protein n=1 Tax=Acidocella sp. TaxID=50710 RepID=UPI002C2A464E|nr:contractile injection system protein, VgrG/Pvc8 family [Acidocella sp.]HVE20658.1 contractile injection system protein, VgrG/Pvc8 family [Acidocella sp.]
MTDIPVLTVNGQNYSGWTAVSWGRGLDRCVSDFDLEVTERWPDSTRPILPLAPATISVGGEQVFAGYVDSYLPSLQADEHSVRITGRGKTQDLVDCSPNVAAGQFSGYTVAAVARALCQMFGIGCDVQTDLANVVIPDVTIQPAESAFNFLDRLCVVAGVIAIDDANGNLLLVTAGTTKSSTVLMQGVNLKAVSAEITSTDRFSEYIVKGQAGLSAQLGASGQTTPAGAQVQTAQVASVTDSSVTRFRPKVFMAESATGQASLLTQAQWHLNYALGRSTKATATVVGWRQDDGTFWAPNLMVTIIAPVIGVNEDLLIYSVLFRLTANGGHETVLTLTPVQAAQPNPRELRQKKGKKGRKGSGIDWTGAGGF